MVHRVVESLLIFPAYSSFDKSPSMFSLIFTNIFSYFSSCTYDTFKNVTITGKRFNR